MQTNKHALTEASLLGNRVPSASWGPTLPLLLRSSSAPLSRGNELLSGGRAHNGTSHNATFTGPYTRPEEQSANQTLSGPSPRGQSSIVVQEEDRGNNNQSPWLSDFSSCPLLLLSIQSGSQHNNFLPQGPTRELLERQGDQRETSGGAWKREKGGRQEERNVNMGSENSREQGAIWSKYSALDLWCNYSAWEWNHCVQCTQCTHEEIQYCCRFLEIPFYCGVFRSSDTSWLTGWSQGHSSTLQCHSHCAGVAPLQQGVGENAEISLHGKSPAVYK